MRYSDIIQTPLPAKPTIPYMYAIASNFFFILAQLIAKTQTTIVSPIFIIYYRSLLMLIINSLLIWWENTQIKEKINDLKEDLDITLSEILFHQQEHKIITLDIMQKKKFILMIKRVIFSCISTILFTMSLQYLQLSVTNALFETAPIFGLFIDAIINKTKVLRVHVMATIVGIVGVGVIAAAQFQYMQHGMLLYLLLPLGAAFFNSCSMFYLHQMKQKVHPLLVVEYLMIGTIMLSGMLFNFYQREQIILPNQLHVFYDKILSFQFIFSTLMMSLLVFGSQYYRVKSLFIVPASKIGPVHYVGIVLSILFDLLVFGYEIKWYQYIGMVMACSGLFMKLIVDQSKSQSKKSVHAYDTRRF